MQMAGNPKGMSIMILCEIPETATEYQAFSNAKSKINIGDIYMLDSNMLRVNGKVPAHNFWLFKFASMF